MPGPLASVVIPAAISTVGSLFGAKKSSTAAKDSARIQTDFSERALAEQRRVYDLEQANEQRQRDARAGIFDQYGTRPGAFGGFLPNPYGMSDAQTSQMRKGFSPQIPSQSTVLRPSGGQPPQAFPVVGAQMGRPTVTLQAPTGEVMDVDVDQVPMLLQKGAIIIQKQGQNAFGGAL